MNKILSLWIIMTTCFIVNGQDRFQLGFQGSNKLTWFNTDENGLSTDGIRYGGGFQIIFDYNITENYILGSGFGLMGLGGKIQYYDTIRAFKAKDSTYIIPDYSIIKQKNQQFTIPLTLKLRTNQVGLFKYFGRIGFNLHLKYKVKGDIKHNSISITDGENISPECRFFNLSTPLGVGIEYPLVGNAILIVEISYNHGWTTIAKQGKNITMSYLSFNTGILF